MRSINLSRVVVFRLSFLQKKKIVIRPRNAFKSLSHYELGSALKLVQKPKRGVPRGCLFFGRNFWLEINKRASQRVFTFGEKTNVLRNEFLRLVSFRTGLETKITL